MQEIRLLSVDKLDNHSEHQRADIGQAHAGNGAAVDTNVLLKEREEGKPVRSEEDISLDCLGLSCFSCLASLPVSLPLSHSLLILYSLP
jgi:hypothetical protein